MGATYSMFKETFPPKPKWSVDQIPNLTGQVTLVTGGNAGIGKETIKALLNKGAKVYLAGRSKSKADEAIEWLKAETGGKSPVFLQLDLADLNSVRRAVDEFKQKEDRLDILFNNGGVMTPPIEMKTLTDYDIQFGTNVLGHYLLTVLLLPVLIHTAQISPRKHARVINLSSVGHWSAPKNGVDYSVLTPNDPDSEARRRKMGIQALYAQSKWANIAFSNELARRYASQGIISISVHPGIIQTELQRHLTLGTIDQALLNWIMRPASYGALTSLYAGTAPEAESFSGQYFIPWARHSKSRADTHDEALGKKLWAWLEEQVELN
ncbi:short chain dehydrogenase [Ceratobasidium sp. AG-Ba]|nr:short chain dehydrogenase [Ceratobasidium sp. AG-Ba]QRW10697.1 short chain dehydrogenase [Ceratobasidium sp. AG-Ba]